MSRELSAPLKSTPSPAPLPGYVPTLDPMALLIQDTASATTRRAYAGHLRNFFQFAGFGPIPTPDTLRAFLSQPRAQIAMQLGAYKATMLDAKIKPATINPRLSAVRALITSGNKYSLCRVDDVRGLVTNVKSRTYRETKGTTEDNIARLLDLPDTETLRGKRDYAILVLLCEMVLRRAELCGLAVADFDAADKRIRILGKGRTETEWLTLSEEGLRAITDYLTAAGHTDGLLFRNFDHRPAHAGGGLTDKGLYALICAYGKQIGVKLSPHRLRHSGITAALEATDGNTRKVQGLSRHLDSRTLERYDRNRRDFQGEMTGLLSNVFQARRKKK